MGAAGAGLATLISRICMPLFTLGYFLFVPSLRRYFLFFAWIAQGWRTTTQAACGRLADLDANGARSVGFRTHADYDGMDRDRAASSTSGGAVAVQYRLYGRGRNFGGHDDHGEPPLRCGRLPGDAPGRTGFLALGNRCEFAHDGLFRRVPPLFAGTLYFGPGGHRGGCSTVFDGRAIPDSRRIADDRPRCTTRNAGMLRIAIYYAFVSYIVINLPVGYFCAFNTGVGCTRALGSASSSGSVSRPSC